MPISKRYHLVSNMLRYLTVTLAIIAQVLGECPANVQTVEPLDTEKVITILYTYNQKFLTNTFIRHGFSYFKNEMIKFQYLGEWYTTYGNINFVTEEGDNCIRAQYKKLSTLSLLKVI